MSSIARTTGWMTTARYVAFLTLSLAALLALHGSVLDLVFAESTLRAAFALVTFAVIVAALADALSWTIARVGSSASSAPAQPALVVPLLWLAMTIAAALTWPFALYPDFWPLLSLLFFTTITAFPAALAERVSGETMTFRLARSWRRVVITVGLIVGFVTATHYAFSIQPYIEGVDFYFFAVYARDLAARLPNVSALHYEYFPGVYTFWSSAIRAGATTLSGLQWAYVALIGANAAAVAAVVGRISRNWPAALLAALWYAAAASRFEGWIGTTEPLVSLPLLVGMLCWGGAPFAGWRGALRAMLLGAGIGLAVYGKQQGALLAVGWLAIIVMNAAVPSARRSSWMAIAMIPIAALGVFAAAIGAERQGDLPIRVGISNLRGYEPEGGLIENLSTAGLLTHPVVIVGVLISVAWLALLVSRAGRARLGDPSIAAAVFASVAGTAALHQFAKRSYPHYAMIALPFLIVAVMLVAVVVVRLELPRLRSRALARFAVIGLAAIPIADAAGGQRFAVWPPSLSPPLVVKPWRLQTGVPADIDALRRLVRPGEDVLVLPPRRNDVHFLLRTRSVSFENGYSWNIRPGVTLRAVGAPALAAVVVVHTLPDPADRINWQAMDCDAAVKALPGAGFQVVADLPTMTLWRRKH